MDEVPIDGAEKGKDDVQLLLELVEDRLDFGTSPSLIVLAPPFREQKPKVVARWEKALLEVHLPALLVRRRIGGKEVCTHSSYRRHGVE